MNEQDLDQIQSRDEFEAWVSFATNINAPKDDDVLMGESHIDFNITEKDKL